MREPLKPIVPADDHAMVLPCASVMVMVVLLNDEFTCAMPEAMFLRSRRRGRAVAGFAIFFLQTFRIAAETADDQTYFVTFFLPAMALAGPLRVRALVWVRCP